MTTTTQSSDPVLMFFVAKLVEKYQPVHLFSFGRIMKQVNIDTCFAPYNADLKQEHFLLMITAETPRIESEVQDYANAHYKDGLITILCFNEGNLKTAIISNNRFFITVINEGRLLYSRDELLQSIKVREYDNSGSIEEAKGHISHRLVLAEGFLDAAGAALIGASFNICVFLLHQCVEQSCILLIRLFMGYRTDVHNLKRLFGLCACFSPRLATFFSDGQQENERLFEILRMSYSSPRYKDGCVVDSTDANQLWLRVGVFLKLVKLMCEERVRALVEEQKH